MRKGAGVPGKAVATGDGQQRPGTALVRVFRTLAFVGSRTVCVWWVRADHHALARRPVLAGVEYELGVLVQGATWPEGVVPWLREAYLPDRVFESVLGMDKAAFYALPEWKQLAKKREVGLF